MDELALTVLKAEMGADVTAFEEAVQTATERLGSGSPTETESCGFHLGRAYNIIEQMSLRTASAFENQIDDRRGWHAELLRRLSLEVPGVRPALFPTDALADLRELRGFRHVVHHAYDVTLDTGKVRAVLASAQRVASAIHSWVDTFTALVAERGGFGDS